MDNCKPYFTDSLVRVLQWGLLELSLLERCKGIVDRLGRHVLTLLTLRLFKSLNRKNRKQDSANVYNRGIFSQSNLCICTSDRKKQGTRGKYEKDLCSSQ